MDADQYRKDPCGASSLSFVKTNRIVIPDTMRIIRDDRYSGAAYTDYADTRYFKTMCNAFPPAHPVLPVGYSFTAIDDTALSAHIAQCYREERLSKAQAAAYRTYSGYDARLWLALRDEKGSIAASGVAFIDKTIGEGTLEWVQVSPAERRKGYGKATVTELLFRMNSLVDFVTVSGRLDSVSYPLRLYQSCGFHSTVIWHILTRRET